jgi:hypothetical protein
MLQRLFKGGNAKFVIHGSGHPPGQDLAAGPVHDCYQVEEAASHRNVANIGAQTWLGRSMVKPRRK